MANLPIPVSDPHTGEWSLECSIDQLCIISGLDRQEVLFGYLINPHGFHEIETSAVTEVLTWCGERGCRFMRDYAQNIRIIFPDQDTGLLFKLTFYR